MTYSGVGVFGGLQGPGVERWNVASHLRIDKTIQEIAVKHKVHPNQVSTWKRQAMDGLGAIFSNGVDKVRVDHESELHDLHAKIGQLTVERDFLARGFKR